MNYWKHYMSIHIEKLSFLIKNHLIKLNALFHIPFIHVN